MFNNLLLFSLMIFGMQINAMDCLKDIVDGVYRTSITQEMTEAQRIARRQEAQKKSIECGLRRECYGKISRYLKANDHAEKLYFTHDQVGMLKQELDDLTRREDMARSYKQVIVIGGTVGLLSIVGMGSYIVLNSKK